MDKPLTKFTFFSLQDRQAEQDSMYEEAFEKMKRAAGVSNIDEVVQR
jgi:hypothetical protein